MNERQKDLVQKFAALRPRLSMVTACCAAVLASTVSQRLSAARAATVCALAPGINT